MAASFRRGRKGDLTVTFGIDEHRVLQMMLGDILKLLQADDGVEEDPLAQALGIGTATETPADPALARLFPDGYVDDAEASADFRRYTEPGLRSAKRDALETALATLGDEPHKIVLSPEEAQAWLGALNDTRLVLGERLGVVEDFEDLLASLEEDDPRLPLLWVYDRLTFLQESLVQALWEGP